MKTLAVLSALATIAIAAPAFEDFTDRTSLSPNDFTITQQREKKSTLPEVPTEKISEPSEDHVLTKTTNKFGQTNSVARTFSGFKKPIIVKKKIGYHVYRDSDEEQAQTDSRESCRKQIKVKLCDDNNSVDKMKSASIDHTHEDISENEMKHSINMAKQAVETFQRDLQKMEHDSVENNEERHSKLGADKELRDDIEKARQALEHIEKKFRSFDSVTTIKDENTPNAHLRIKSDEERMVQWKEVGNKFNNFEVGKNLEDNFKSTDEHDITKLTDASKFKKNNLKDADIKSIATIEDIDARTNTDKETNIEDGITSVVEDKKTKMEIHSDSLVKEVNEDIHQKGKSHSPTEQNIERRNEMMEKNVDNVLPHHDKHLEVKSSASDNVANTKNDEHVTTENQKDKERMNKDDLKTHDLHLKEKHVSDDGDNIKNNGMLKSSVDKQIELKNDLQSGHVRSLNENDQVTHASNNVATSLSKDNKETLRSGETEMLNKGSTTANDQHLLKKHHGHKDDEQRSTILETSPIESESHSHSHLKEIPQHKEQHRSAQIKSEQEHLLHEDGSHRSLATEMDTQKLALPKSTSSLDDDKNHFKNHLELQDNENHNDHAMPAHLRASSNFHKELLNNMDFTEDAHHMHLNAPSHAETGHMKNENIELQERFNVPRLQPNSEHLKTMMHLSDNSHHETLQRPQLKMASMINNEQPNFNVQFNSPQTLEEQSNVQGLMPFKAAEDFHDEHLHKSNFEDKLDTMHAMEEIPSAVHDPLKIRWSHDNSEKLKAAHIEQDTMKMDGSSQHFNIDKSMAGRTNFMDQRMDLNNQMHSHQRWAQGKMNPNMALQNFQTNMQMNDNSHSLHNHDAFLSRNNEHVMIHGKSNMDSSMQPSSFMHMRGAPKMALEYNNQNQWTRNHGAFRSSYGPSYGSGGGGGGGGGGGSSSGGSAVGLFPNANVGNCAVPLLLSCSPSVVSGSLAKTNTYSSNSYGSNSYSAPSYRSEDMNFLTKRGIDIDNTLQGLKVQRHIPLSNQPNIILEKKQ